MKMIMSNSGSVISPSSKGYSSPTSRKRGGSFSSLSSYSLASINGCSNKEVFKVKTIIGTTATSDANFCVIDNMISYTAGAGAVVACLDRGGEKITGHRFFCTSSKGNGQSVKAAQNTPSWLSDPSSWSAASGTGSPSRDSNGYLLPPMQAPSYLNPNYLTSFHTNSLSLGEDSSSSTNYQRSVAKLKMKTTTAVALSNDGTLLAVGETGHLPRVFVYSTAPDATTKPLAIMSEHRFGIKGLSFSPCGRFLASLGTSNDGFLHVWYLSLKEGLVQLHSSNRCISYVHDMKWLDSTKLVTIGVRHVRVWKVEQNRPQSPDVKANILMGRNFVLQEFSTSTFVAISVISENMAIISSNKGELATIEDNNGDERAPVFTPRISAGFDVATIDVDIENKVIWVAGANDNIKRFSLEWVLNAEPLKMAIPSSSSPLKLKSLNSIILAVAAWEQKKVVALTGGRDISILTVGDDEADVQIPQEKCLSCHAPELRGIRAMYLNPKTFLTWNADGGVRAWNNKGEGVFQTGINLEAESELTIVCQDSTGDTLMIGTSQGEVQIIKLEQSTCSHTLSFNAHGSSVVWIDYYYDADNGREMFASCSRDRTIQVFLRSSSEGWQLHQTLTAHKGNILKVKFTRDGKRLISCSADRTVHIHKLVVSESTDMLGFLSEKVVSLKTGPSDMEIESGTGNIVLSCDKQIFSYRVPTGELLSNYRTIDETLESVNLGTISIKQVKDKKYLVGMGSDKGIRVYEHPSGQFIGSAWGHSEGISGLGWIDGDNDDESIVVSGGTDGCIFLWNIQPTSGSPANSITSSNVLTPTVSKISPTRKILSKAELAQLSPRSPATPTPSNKQLQQQRLSASSTPARAPHRRITPSKSLSELRPRKTIADEKVEMPAPPKLKDHTPPSSIPKRSSGNNSVDDLCTDLARFRETYRKTVTPYDQTKIEKLKQELKQSIRLLEGTVNERTRVDELMEMFGERLTTIVSQKSNA